jgi:nucleotide-binding universal stress UspA family protein
MSKIVVGVDGSESSKEALRWAIGHAERGDTLVAVHAWSIPTPVAVPFDALPIVATDHEDEAHKLLDVIVADVEAETHGVPVEKRVVRRQPGEALVRASGDADLLVIGSRGHGPVRRLVLSSVGQYCTTHASCPVVVTPHHERAA